MKILVATLCSGGTVSVDHYRSVIETILVFKQELPELKFTVAHIATSMNSYARNAFASMVLNDPTFSHLLFISADMGFHPSLIVRMLAFGKPVVGCVLPETRFDYKRFHNSRLSVDNAQIARYLATDCIGGDRALVTTRGPDGEQPQLVDGFVRVDHASTGILLIRREALQLMKEKFPELWLDDSGSHYRDSGLKGGVLQCFEGFQGPDGVFIRDDLAFCRRWTEGCGGEIWSCIDEPVSRAGEEPFLGHYLLKMKQEGIIVLSASGASQAVSTARGGEEGCSAPAG
jgi:hypothetical protein